MDILSSLNNVICFIESNICEDIIISELACGAAMSEYELLNLFHSLTGMTIKEYIRKRRLTLAAMDIQNTDDRIIDIAVKYGYVSEDSFRRAFFAQHAITPSMARDKSNSIVLYPPLSFHIKVEGAEKMDFKIIETEEKVVYGISKKCPDDADRYELAHYMWSVDCEHIPEKISDGYDGTWYGIWHNNRYLIAREKADCQSDNLEKHVIPAGRYIVFTTERGGYAGEELPKLHNEIFNSYLPDSPYSLVSDYELEVYHLFTDRTERRKNRYYEIRLPIE